MLFPFPKEYRVLPILALWMFASCNTEPEEQTPKQLLEPQEALATFDVEPGFEIKLIASDPLIADPVDMEIDEYGRLYVLEMHGYPLDKSGAGRVMLLSDTDGDGQMDKSTTFADSLVLPYGIMRWKQGLLVADPPHLYYLEDTTGNGEADTKEIMLTGFALTNAHMTASNPLYGLDNWIYLTSEHGGGYKVYEELFNEKGSAIHYPQNPDTPQLPKEATGRTIRFRPNTNQLELTSGKTQYGHGFTQWGDHILGNNAHHVYHEVIGARYLQRNPDLSVPNATHNGNDHGTDVHGITENPELQVLSGVGVYTAACGNTIYTGGAFPEPFREHTHFVCEPASNIVHVDKLIPDGASFTASRVGRDDKEFLASTDAWFRPVNLYVGPDGALYVVDYYRQIIEHPEWMSEEAIQAGELYNGNQQGRIYRIAARDGTPAFSWTKGLRLGDATNEELVATLAHANGWWRLNAQRLLIDREATDIIIQLAEVATNPTSALGRLHALWTLEGLNELTPELIAKALHDEEAGIRENAIKLAEQHLDNIQLVNTLMTLQDDESPKVRFQLLCTLGYLDKPAVAQVRETMLFNDLRDNWMQVAALSTSSLEKNALLAKLIKDYREDNPAYISLIERLTTMIGTSSPPENVRTLIQKAILNADQHDKWPLAMLQGLARGIERRKIDNQGWQKTQDLLINTFFDHADAAIRRASLQLLKAANTAPDTQLDKAFTKAASIAANPELPTDQRAEAVAFLTLDNPEDHSELFMRLIASEDKATVQRAAINSFGQLPDEVVIDYLMEEWPALSSGLKDEAVIILLASADRVKALLDAIDEGKVKKTDIDSRQRIRLMAKSSPDLRLRARSMFALKSPDETNKPYKKSLEMEGDAIAGKIVYAQHCAMCHQVRGKIGVSYGPDLGTVKQWRPEGLLTNILSPSLSVPVGYELWDITMKNGESIQGIIESETTVAITLKMEGNAKRIINRQEVKEINELNVSAMPTGFEEKIDPEQMANLIAFLLN